MFTEAEVLHRTNTFIAQEYPNFSLRMVLPRPLKLPGGWRVVYESYPEFGLRQSGTMVIVFITDNGDIEDPPEYDELMSETRPELSPIIPESELDHLIQKARLPELNAAIVFAKQKFSPEARVVTYEPVINTYMQKMDLQVVCWRFDIFVGHSHHKVFIGYRDDGSGELDLYDRDISHQKRHLDPFDYRRLKRYGRLDLNYKTGNLGIRIDLRRVDKSTAFSQDRLMLMRDELLLWYCKAHAANYLEKIGYGGLEYTLISLERKAVSRAELELGQAPYLDPLGIIFIGRNATIISPIVFRDASQTKLLMASWFQDPSIVFHELGHAIRYLLYTQEHNHGIEEGFCDYFSAILMDDLLDIPGFAYSEGGGIGSLLPPQFGRGRFIPRCFGGTKTPPDYEDIAESERPYALGWKWAHFLWQLRDCLYEATGNWLKADEVITAAHFKPRLPKNQEGLSIVAAYQQSVWNTIQVHHIPIPESVWESLILVNQPLFQ